MHATTFCSCAAHSDLNSCCYITELDACCHVLQFITILPHKVVTCMQLCSYVQLLATITQLSLSVLLLLTARKRKSVHRAQHCELAGWNATTSVQLSLKSLHSCMGRGASETRSNPAVPGHRSIVISAAVVHLHSQTSFLFTTHNSPPIHLLPLAIRSYNSPNAYQ